jgi:O-antigen/teichoic acid export membrane protein
VRRVLSKLRAIDARDKLIYTNIAYSLVLKGVSVFISFFSVRISLDFLSQSEYGVWLTIMSVLNWITLLDLGFGSGLRNNLSEALAENNMERARKLVSTAYISLSGIFLAAMIIILPLIGLLNWASLLHVAPTYASEIKNSLSFPL